jgi:hypothetical protein
MSVPQHTSPVLGLGAFGLLVGVVLLIIVLVAVRQDRPGDGRCAELWNAPANQANRSVVDGHAFPLATVRGVPPNKAGQPGCSVFLWERQDGPWLWFGAYFVTETSVVWDGGVSGVRYGQIARPAMGMTRPTRCSSRMGALCFGDLGLLYGCSGALTAPSTVAPSFEGLPTRRVVIADGPHPPVELVTVAATPERGCPPRPCPPRARSIGN